MPSDLQDVVPGNLFVVGDVRVVVGVVSSLSYALGQANPVVLSNFCFKFVDRRPIVWKLRRQIANASGLRVQGPRRG